MLALLSKHPMMARWLRAPPHRTKAQRDTRSQVIPHLC